MSMRDKTKQFRQRNYHVDAETEAIIKRFEKKHGNKSKALRAMVKYYDRAHPKVPKVVVT